MVHPVSKLKGFGSGLCIGAADLIPGISGGTVALILGIYEQLIDGLRSFDLKEILQGNFRKGFAKVPFAFLASVIGGMALSIALLVQVIHAVMADPVYRPLLYAFFFGLVLASAYMILGHLKTWKPSYILLGAAGAAAAFFLSGIERGNGVSGYSTHFIWVFFCGAAGISAMLLPGISGGYLLNVLGMYEPVIASLSKFIKGLAAFSIDWDAFNLIAALGLGILFGALAFSRVVSWALRHYHDVTIATLVGFMLGALRSVWPFMDLATMQPYMPAIHDGILWGALLLFMAGFFIVLAADRCAHKKPCKESVHGRGR